MSSFSLIMEEIKKANALIELEKYDQALSVYENNLGKVDYLDGNLYLGMAVGNYCIGNFEKSIELAKSALSKRSSLGHAQWILAVCNRKLGNAELHKTHIDLALELEPENISYQHEKALYYINSKQYVIALDILQSIEEKEPNNKNILYSLCRVYFNTNDTKNFNSKLKSAMTIHPHDTDFHYLLSEKHLSDENYELAIKSAKNSLEINPTNKAAQETLETAKLGPQHVLGFGMIIFIIIRIILLIMRNS